MNYDLRLAAVCGDARLPSQRVARLFKIGPKPQPRDDFFGDADGAPIPQVGRRLPHAPDTPAQASLRAREGCTLASA